MSPFNGFVQIYIYIYTFFLTEYIHGAYPGPVCFSKRSVNFPEANLRDGVPSSRHPLRYSDVCIRAIIPYMVEYVPADDRPSFLVEVCTDSVDASARAMEHGAGRLEVCSRLAHGGYTPDMEVLDAVLELRAARYPSCRVFAMVRPWLKGKDNFEYSTAKERKALFDDLDAVASRGVDGVVVGALYRDKNGFLSVDNQLMTGLCLVADRRNIGDVTFHRAFDEIHGDRDDAIHMLGRCGTITRILTSGGKGQASRVVDGHNMENIFRYQLTAAPVGITILPGSGLDPENVAETVKWTGCREVHGSFGGGALVGEVVRVLEEVSAVEGRLKQKGESDVDELCRLTSTGEFKVSRMNQLLQ